MAAPMIPEYHVALRQLMEDEQPALWRWFVQSLRTSKQDTAEAELDILKSAYRLDGDGHAALAGIAHVLAGRLGLDCDVVLYQALTDPGSGRCNAGVTVLGTTAHVVFAGDLLTLLDLGEQEAVLAHELAHVWLFRHDGGAYRVLDHLLHRLTAESDAAAVAETARRLRLHTEVFADQVAAQLVSVPVPELAVAATGSSTSTDVPLSTTSTSLPPPMSDTNPDDTYADDSETTSGTPAPATHAPALGPGPSKPDAHSPVVDAPDAGASAEAPTHDSNPDAPQRLGRSSGPSSAQPSADTLATLVRALVKLHSGLHHVDADAYLRQARQILEADSSSSEGWTHPELHVRIACLAANHTSAIDATPDATLDAKRSSIVDHLINGNDDLDRLDLLGQRRLARLTARVLAGAIPIARAVPSAPTEGILLHVTMFDAQIDGIDTGDAEPLADDELAAASPSVRHYAAALVLDLAMLIRNDDAELSDLEQLAAEALRIGAGDEFEALMKRATATAANTTGATR